MFSSKQSGFVASVLSVAWLYMSTIGLAVLAAAVINALFTLLVGFVYNLCIASVLGWAHAPFWFVWGVFMVGWALAQWFKSFATIKKES